MPFKPQSALAALSFATLTSTPLAAQQQSEALPEKIEELTVTGRFVERPDQLPQKITILDQDAVRDQLSLVQDPAQVLSQLLPSFSPARQKLTGFGETFRGRSPLFLVNGVPQSNPLRDGSRDGFTLDPAVIERIEVVFGANAIQGLGATGGAINYITKSAPADGSWLADFTVQGTAASEFQDDGFGFRSAAVVGKRAGKFEVVASASYQIRELFFDGEGDAIGIDTTQGDLADSDQRNFYGKIGYTLNADQRLEISINDFQIDGDGDFRLIPGDIDTGVPATVEPGGPRGVPATNDVQTLSANYSHDALLGGELDLQLYRQDFEAVFGGGVFGIFQDPRIAPVGELFEQSANISEKLGGRVTYKRPDILKLPLRGIVGVDVLRDRTKQALVQTGREWVPETSFMNVAPFAQLVADPHHWITLSAGFRVENATLSVDDFTTIAGNTADFQPVEVDGGDPSFTDVLANAGAVLRPISGLDLFASYSEGFTIADIGRVLRGISEPGTDVDDLLTLEPVVTRNIEVGAEYAGAFYEISANWYRSAADLGSRLRLDDDGIFNVERERTVITGIEASATVRPIETVTMGVQFAYIDGEFDSNADGRVDTDLSAIDIPPNRLDSFIEYEPEENMSLRVQTFSLFDRTFRDSDGNVAASFEGYTVADAIASYGWQNLTASVGIRNLADKQFTSFFSQAASVRDDRFFAGQGRTYTLTLGFAL